jgi:antitoxin PrlF
MLALWNERADQSCGRRGGVIESGKEFPYYADMITSRITSKSQTTLPRAVRSALGLRPGDTLAYQIEGDRAVLVRQRAEPRDDPFTTFREWDSEADRKAYADL